MVTAGSRVSLDEVKKYPAGAIFPDPEAIVAPRDPDWEGRFELAHPAMLDDLAGVVAESPERTPGYDFRLVSRRQMNVLNSVGRDEPGQHRGLTTNPAYMHPSDLDALGLAEGDLVEIRSARASILGVAAADANLRAGLVSMTHSWGEGPDRDADVREIGSNTGRLSAVDIDYERYTGLPRMSNIPVSVSRSAV